jgi:hypothetical protein
MAARKVHVVKSWKNRSQDDEAVVLARILADELLPLDATDAYVKQVKDVAKLTLAVGEKRPTLSPKLPGTGRGAELSEMILGNYFAKHALDQARLAADLPELRKEQGGSLLDANYVAGVYVFTSLKNAYNALAAGGQLTIVDNLSESAEDFLTEVATSITGSAAPKKTKDTYAAMLSAAGFTKPTCKKYSFRWRCGDLIPDSEGSVLIAKGYKPKAAYHAKK